MSAPVTMPFVPPLNHREKLGAWLNEMGLTGAMVEVGCAFGGYARQVLATWKGRKYVMVDPWIAQPKEVYKERTEGTPYEGWFADCQKLAAEDPRVLLERRYSGDAAPLFADGAFDCVYLDGNHCLEAVEADLDAWWPKVQRGGLFCGHDFYDATTEGHYCQVETAVRSWAARHNLPIHLTECSSWWILKP